MSSVLYWLSVFNACMSTVCVALLLTVGIEMACKAAFQWLKTILRDAIHLPGVKSSVITTAFFSSEFRVFIADEMSVSLKFSFHLSVCQNSMNEKPIFITVVLVQFSLARDGG
jgi:hypothetical protein